MRTGKPDAVPEESAPQAEERKREEREERKERRTIPAGEDAPRTAPGPGKAGGGSKGERAPKGKRPYTRPELEVIPMEGLSAAGPGADEDGKGLPALTGSMKP